MASIFKRLFRVAEAESHAAIDKIEDPIKLTEQGIRDLKKDLQTSLQALAEAKSVLIRVRKDMEHHKLSAADYEKKAILLLKRAESGQLEGGEADRLATEALTKKEQALSSAATFQQQLEAQQSQTSQLEANVNTLKSNIQKWENELVTLKARAKVASASKKLNKQLSQVDSAGTVALLERMKDKVSEDEALAESYGQMASLETSIDSEINKALAGGGSSNSSLALDELKAKLKAGQ